MLKSLLKKIILTRGEKEALKGTDTLKSIAALLLTPEQNDQIQSQLGQDIFVLIATQLKRNGYFVEFGATDGKHLSNTFLLEKQFGWSGIVAEPSKSWGKSIFRNRECIIETRCVWTESGQKVSFHDNINPELSTIIGYENSDGRNRQKTVTQEYEVETVSLNDLLREHGAPKDFDYLSIDTEGTELKILSEFDLHEFKPKVITVEHNFTKDRSEIERILTSFGYKRVLAEISRWDDWYLRT